MKTPLSVLLFFFIYSITVYGLDAKTILDRSNEIMHPQNLQGTFTMTLYSSRGHERSMEVKAYQKSYGEDRENRLFIFEFPPNVKGTGLLIHSYLATDQDKMWLFLPVVGKVKRVNLNAAGTDYFMGSDFTYNDLLSTGLDEFDTEVTEDTYNGEECYVVLLKGRTKEIQRKYGYSLERRFFRKTDFVQVRSLFLDLAGDLLKEFSVEEVFDTGDYLYPSRVRMENLQTGHVSTIAFDDISASETIPEDYFTYRYLENQ